MIERGERQRTPKQQHQRQRQRRGHRNDQSVVAQHPGGGAQKEILKPRLPSGTHGLDHCQQDDAKPKENRQDRANRRILGQPCAVAEP